MVGKICWMIKSQQIYPTDLNDTQWSKIRPYLPAEAQQVALANMAGDDIEWHFLSPAKRLLMANIAA